MTRILNKPAALVPARTETKPTTSPLAPQVQKPLTGWQANGATRMPASTKAEQHQMEIVCPVLSSMVKEGRLPMDSQGNIKLSDLRRATDGLGVSKPMTYSLTAIGWSSGTPREIIGNMFNGKMNLLELRSGITKHPSDSAILNSGKFDEARFQALVAHAQGGVMTASSFSAAIADNTRRDIAGSSALAALGFGKPASLVEFSALLAMFGTKDKVTGEVGIPVEQLRAMYQDRKLPPPNGATLVEMGALQASMALKVDANLARGAFGSTASASGLSSAGIRLSEGSGTASTAAANASLSAGRAANCPHLAGKKPMPTAVSDVINAHTPAGASS